jgi:alpha-methylacyl-CoA racemase
MSDSTAAAAPRSGPLAGLRIIEIVGLGPGPFAGMLLSDMGAEVIAVDRPSAAAAADTSKPATNAMNRGKRSIAVDLKSPEGVETVLKLVETADVLFEPYRPGVAERLGIGPDECLARNPKLVYGRMTGFGQTGPFAARAGHDLNYLAVSGVVEALGREGQPPTPPINLVADFGGGGLLLAYGIACACFEAERSGQGQVVDAAMIDGAATLMTPFYSARNSGFWGPRGTNHLDGGAAFYDSYQCADGRWLAIAAIEPQFLAAMLDVLGISAEDFGQPFDKGDWARQKDLVASVVKTRTRDEWEAAFEGIDACVTPVLTPEEAPSHPHNVARESFATVEGVPQPMPSPRFSRTPGAINGPPTHPGQHTTEILTELREA